MPIQCLDIPKSFITEFGCVHPECWVVEKTFAVFLTRHYLGYVVFNPIFHYLTLQSLVDAHFLKQEATKVEATNETFVKVE